jgi:hypothetical protein
LKVFAVNFTSSFSLPFILGGTVDENIAISEDAEIVEKTFREELECFIDFRDLDPNGGIEKIVSIIAENKCVTAELLFFHPDADHTFEGICLGAQGENTEESFIKSLAAIGISATDDSGMIVLPDHFITIELGEYICWWDESYWGRAGFLDEVLGFQE